MVGSILAQFDFCPPLCLMAGHFTQVVWKESTQLGVGVANDGIKVFVVGQYRPAGNMNTKENFYQNVLPPGNILP